MRKNSSTRMRGPVVIALAALVLAGCGERPADDGRPTVAVTIYPLANLIEQMVGDEVEVVCLLPAGQSPHHAELTSNKLAALKRADAVVTVGLGLDAWVRRAGAEAPVVRCGALLGIAADGGHDDHAHHAHDHDHEHDHGPIDPHVWTDPVLTRQLLPMLATQLTQQLPEHAAAIESGARQLDAELTELDEAFATRLAPFEGAAIVTYHSAFNRLAERYGLVVAATLAPVETPGAMTLKARQEAVEVIERHGLKVIFAEPQFPPAAADALHRQTGVRVLTLDPLGDPNVPERSTYQAMMRYNLDQLVEGLGMNRGATGDAETGGDGAADGAHHHDDDQHDHAH